MPYLNKLQIIGHVGKDAEVRTTPSGDTVLTFSVATAEKWKDRGGSPQERTTWHRVERWKAPEWMAGALTRGALVYVEGTLHCETWEKDGQKREAWKVRADNVLPLEKSNRVAGASAALRSELAAAGVDDVPF